MRRPLALLMLVLLTAACGEGSQIRDVLDDEPTTAPGPAPAPGGPGDPGAATATGQARTGSAHPAGPGKAVGGPQSAASAEASPTGPPGSYAGVLVRPRPAAKLVLELLVAQDAEPADGVPDHMAEVLVNATGKDVAIQRVNIDAEARTWSDDELRSLAAGRGSAQAGSGQAVVRALFVGGKFGEENVLGVALSGHALAIFPDEVEAASGPLTGAAALERAVATHELGHLLGLVDLFFDTGRDDPSHPGHSRNSRSVMYWAIESGLVSDILNGPPPEQFDDADRADLAAIRAS